MAASLQDNKIAAPSQATYGVLALGLFLALILTALYQKVLLGLVQDWWHDDNYSHGFLVPFFSGWLVWQKREELNILNPKGSWWGFGLLLTGVSILILGEIAALDFFTRGSFIIVLAGLLWFHLGTAIFRVLVFPLGFLIFMIPLPATVFNAIAFPLQGLASQNATWMLDLLGVPVLRDGNIIYLSHMSLGVTEACSGIRSLISLLALAVAWAYLMLPRGWVAIVFVIATVPITIAANAGRVILTGLIGQQFGFEYAQGFFHLFSGWIIFVVAAGCLLGGYGFIYWLILVCKTRIE